LDHSTSSQLRLIVLDWLGYERAAIRGDEEFVSALREAVAVQPFEPIETSQSRV
jgi:hypothetical protein